MSYKFAVASVLIAAAAITTAAAKDDKKVNIKQVMDGLHHKWSQSMLAGDCKTMATFYAPKGTLMPPNAPKVDGRAAIEQFCTSFGKTNIVLDMTESGQMGGSAWCTGSYKILGADGKSLDAGKWVEIWAETENGWKIYKDIWNSDMPAPAAAPAHK
jgi:ketosteroid isomerase-like protein